MGEKSEPGSVPSCRVHAEAAHAVDHRETYLSFPPSFRTSLLLCREQRLAPTQTQRNATQRSATQRDPTTPSDPNPAQPSPSYPNSKLARLVPRQRAPATWSPSLESRQVGASLEIQRSSSRTGPAPGARPHPVSTLAASPAYLPTQSGRTHDFCLRDSPCPFASSEPAFLPACLSACLPDFLPARDQPRSTIHTRTRSISSFLSYPALPCPTLILHRISARYTPRRAAPPALPTSVELRGTHTQSHSPTVHGQPPRGRPCPAHTPCPH